MPRKTSTKKHSAVPKKFPSLTTSPTTEAAVAPALAKSAVADVLASAAVKTVGERIETAAKPAVAQTAAVAPAATVAPVAAKPVVAAVVGGPSEALSSLLNELESMYASTRATAAVEIGRLGERAGVPALIAALNDSDADVARDVAASLGLLGDRSAVGPLINTVENSNGYFHCVVRAAAASSLAQLGDVRAVDALVGAVNDPAAEASAEAVRALATLGDARAVEPLIEVVRNANGYFLPIVRRAAVLALAQLGGEQAAAELSAVASNSWEDPVIREAAEKAGCHGSMAIVNR
ncbi:MAG: lyase domain protein repeat-containing protein [Phycisphaerales bacterium]|nr:lyase domain protein repeat-containing protein [Phycisphaerales bacterium]